MGARVQGRTASGSETEDSEEGEGSFAPRRTRPEVPTRVLSPPTSRAHRTQMRRNAQDCDPRQYRYTPRGRMDARFAHVGRAHGCGERTRTSTGTQRAHPKRTLYLPTSPKSCIHLAKSASILKFWTPTGDVINSFAERAFLIYDRRRSHAALGSSVPLSAGFSSGCPQLSAICEQSYHLRDYAEK